MIFVAGDFALSKKFFVFFILGLLVLEFIRELLLLLGGPRGNFPPQFYLFIYLFISEIGFTLFDSLFRSYFPVSQTDYY